MTVRKSTKVNL